MKIKLSMQYIGALLLIALIGCGHNVYRSENNLVKIMEIDNSIFPPVYFDTPQNKHLPDVILRDKEIITSVKKNAIFTPDMDTLYQRNLELQRIAIRTLDRAHDVRIQKDSALDIVKGVRDTIKKMRNENKLGLQSSEILSKDKTLTKKEMYIGLILLVILHLISYCIQLRNRVENRNKLTS